VAYPETKGRMVSQHPSSTCSADFLPGKSLEEIDEIFGDVKVVHEDDIVDKKGALDTVDVREVKA
jgi:hypothetical protein